MEFRKRGHCWMQHMGIYPEESLVMVFIFTSWVDLGNFSDSPFSPMISIISYSAWNHWFRIKTIFAAIFAILLGTVPDQKNKCALNDSSYSCINFMRINDTNIFTIGEFKFALELPRSQSKRNYIIK